MSYQIAESKTTTSRGIPFAIGGELSAISLWRAFPQYTAEILLYSDYEEADLEKLAREVGCRPTHQTDPGKLAGEVDLSLLLATTLCYLIKKNITTMPSPSESPSPAPVTETR